MTTREIRSLASGFRKGLIGSREGDMMCAVVSYALQSYLSFLGQESNIEEVSLRYSNHVFLRLPDGRVLDATADQFGQYPKIYIGEPLWFHTDRKERAA